MTDKKPNRWNAARDANDAAKRCPARNYGKRWCDAGYPVARIIFRVLVLACVAAAVLSFGGVL